MLTPPSHYAGRVGSYLFDTTLLSNKRSSILAFGGGVLNTHYSDFTNDIIEGFTFVKLNESERLNNPDLTTDNIITTLGKKGAEYKNVLFESPNPQDTIDVSGAGDTFTAAFIVKYYQLKDERTAIQFANRKASEVVSQRGVATPTQE